MQAKLTVPTLLMLSVSPANYSSGFQQGPPLSLTISLICFCGVLLLIFGVLILGFVVRGKNRNGDEGDKL